MNVSSWVYTSKSGRKDRPSLYKKVSELQKRISRLPEHWSTYVDVANIDENSEKIQDNLPHSQPPNTTNNEPQNQDEEVLLYEEI